MTTKKKQEIKGFVLGALRRASYRWMPRYETLRAARLERGLYLCQMPDCGQIVKKAGIQMDHVDPVVPIEGFGEKGWDWDVIVNRMFPPLSGWMALCKDCHSEKTKLENERRKEVRAKNKKP
jgi:5-methylcytosine-specific restriction endonuclease McrA